GARQGAAAPGDRVAANPVRPRPGHLTLRLVMAPPPARQGRRGAHSALATRSARVPTRAASVRTWWRRVCALGPDTSTHPPPIIAALHRSWQLPPCPTQRFFDHRSVAD